MKIDVKHHLKHPWVSHSLLADFEVEDVWQLPVTLLSEHNLDHFQQQFAQADKTLSTKGPAKVLFQLRLLIGNLFNWDEKTTRHYLVPGSIRERYAKSQSLSFDQLPSAGEGSFVPVYGLQNETLLEIENSTVHAAIHFGKVPLNEEEFTVQMTVYVQPKGLFGRLYMLIIKPFRLFIVYPTLIKLIGNNWEKSKIESTVY